MTFDANGGVWSSGEAMRYVKIQTDTEKVAAESTPVRNGYTFLGWSTDGSVTAKEFKNATAGPMTDANAKKYFKIDTIKTPGVEIPFTADTTVYAIWEARI